MFKGGRTRCAPTGCNAHRLTVVGEDIILPFRGQTKLRLPPTGSCREATEGVLLINRCYLRTPNGRPYGVWWGRRLCGLKGEPLIHRKRSPFPSMGRLFFTPIRCVFTSVDGRRGVVSPPERIVYLWSGRPMGAPTGCGGERRLCGLKGEPLIHRKRSPFPSWEGLKLVCV